MAITIRDLKPGAPPDRNPIQRNIASLVGGVIIALGCFVLWLLVVSEVAALTWPWIAGGAVFAIAVGVWIRVADL